MRKRYLFFLFLVLVGTPLVASMQQAVTIEGHIVNSPRAGTLLDLSLTANLDTVGHVKVFVKGSEFLADVDESRELTLDEGIPAHIFIPLAVQADGALATVSVRIVKDGDPIVARVLEFLRANHRVRRATAAEYDAALSAEIDRRAELDAERAAKEHINALIAAGLRPVAVPDDNSTAAQRAWNRLATAQPAQGRIRANCGDYTLSPYNTTFSVSGDMRYQDDYTATTPQSTGSGYTVTLTTFQDYRDSCGNVQYRNITYYGSTASTGRYSISNVTSAVNPAGANPFTEVATLLPDVGVRQSTSTAGTYLQWQRISDPSLMGFSWTGATAMLDSLFNSSDSTYYFFFRWEEELVRLKKMWSLNRYSAYADFVAGYSPTETGAFFFQLDPNSPPNALVVFGSDSRTLSKWIMAHECGHFFQYRMQHAQLCCGGAHAVCSVANAGTAFTEGFADWHGSYWESEGRGVYFNCTNGECRPCAPTSSLLEGNVMGFFWDIFDNVNDPAVDGGLDDVYMSFPQVFDLWAKRNYTSFGDFFTDMQSKGIWPPGSSGDTLRTVNHLN